MAASECYIEINPLLPEERIADIWGWGDRQLPDSDIQLQLEQVRIFKFQSARNNGV